MKLSRTAQALLSSAVASIALGLSAAAALAATSFDLSPEQHLRLHSEQISEAIKEIPDNYRFVEKDTLTIGIVPGLPPISTYATDAKTIVGFDPDLAQLVADSLGKKLVLVPIAWPDWPLGLVSGKFDAVISNVTVTEERKEKFDFSTYRKDQLGFYVKSTSKIISIKEPKDIAGLRIITDAGTNQEKILLDWDKQNVAQGLKPVSVQYYDDAVVRNVAIQSGRADAVFSVNAEEAYQAAQQGKIKLVGTVSGGWPRTAEVAITTRKGSGLDEALTTSLNGLIKSGKYHQLLDKWSLGSEAIDHALTNPPGLPKS